MLTSEVVHTRFTAKKRILHRYMDQGSPEAEHLAEVPVPSPSAGQPHPSSGPTHGVHRWLVMAICLVLVLILGFSLYWFVFRHKPAAPSTTSKNHHASSQPAADATTNATPTAYVSKGIDLN